MPGFDEFNRRRLIRAVARIREKTGQLPTFGDLEQEGFDREAIKEAVRAKLLEELYVTLTSGTVVKGFKLGPAG